MAARQFYAKRKSFGLTYSKISKDAVKEDFHAALMERLEQKNQKEFLEYCVTALENHDPEKEGYDAEKSKHFHCFLKFNKDITVRGDGYFDVEYLGETQHPNIITQFRSYVAWDKYIKKCDDYIVEGEFDREAAITASEGKKSYVAQKILNKGKIDEEIMAQHPELLYDLDKVSRNLSLWNRMQAAASVTLDIESFYPWQQKANRIVDEKPHPRRIHWIVDYEGDSGKSHLARWWSVHKKAFLAGSSERDVLFAYGGEPIVVFDLMRQQDGEECKYVYKLIEKIKNGHFFAGKYESRAVIWNIPHVFVFSNWDPDQNQLSKDRWDIWRLNKETKDTDGVPRSIADLDAQIAQRFNMELPDIGEEELDQLINEPFDQDDMMELMALT